MSDELMVLKAQDAAVMPWQRIAELAIQEKTTPDVLDRLLDVQARWEAMQARRAYTEAMTAFKGECPPVIGKDAEVAFSGTRYKHATLGHVVATVTALLSKHALSVSWETKQENAEVWVTCHITHERGHRESTTLHGPEDTSGKKNPIQQIGSSVTYLQRYTLLAALGLATADQDNDSVYAYQKGDESADVPDGATKTTAGETAAKPAASDTPSPRRDEPGAGDDDVGTLIDLMALDGISNKALSDYAASKGKLAEGDLDMSHIEPAALRKLIEPDTWLKVRMKLCPHLAGIRTLCEVSGINDMQLDELAKQNPGKIAGLRAPWQDSDAEALVRVEKNWDKAAEWMKVNANLPF